MHVLVSRDFDLENLSLFFLVEVKSPEEELAMVADEENMISEFPCLKFWPLVTLSSKLLTNF